MADFLLRWSNEIGSADLSVAPQTLVGEGVAGRNVIVARTAFEPHDGLETALILSLFTDREAEPDDELGVAADPVPDVPNRRGWWGDAYSRNGAGDRIGSRLWLLEAATLTEDTRARALAYCREALEWMVRDGIAASVDVEVFVSSESTLEFDVTITRPTEGESRFAYVWRAAA